MNVYVREYRKIEHRTRRRTSFAWHYLPTLLLLTAAVVVGKIYVQSVAIRWSDRALEQKTTARDLETANDALARSIAVLTTRDRVTHLADQRLGMVTPTEMDVVWLPVPDGTPAHAPPLPAEIDGGVLATVGGWLDALWQEEALALTSQ